MRRLGILDYAVIDEGCNAQMALEQSVELAKLADRLGYARFWMAEHHNVPAFASSSPEMMMMHLANQTKEIRIGSGGVMISHYSSLKIAENMRLLETFHPNRIDLGMGNTLGTSIVNKALNEFKQGKLDYGQQISDIYDYITDNEDKRFRNLTANPVISSNPDMWLLSTSVKSAKIAGEKGIGYTFGFFPFASKDKWEVALQAVKTYKETFRPSKIMTKPHTLIAPFVVVAETNQQAEKYAKSLDIWLLGKNQFSYFKQYPSVETAETYNLTDKEIDIIARNRTRMIVGDINCVKSKLQTMIDYFGVDDLLLIPLLPGVQARKRAIMLLAQAFNLKI